MGCSSSVNTVQPLGPEEAKEDEDETGSKLDGRGDSAVSKGTKDSGVVMEENRELPVLPGALPRKLPPLTRVGESEADRVTEDGLRQQSSEILEELLNEGIIPVGQRGSAAGEAYSIMLDDREGVRRRPPARLESLKADKMQSLPSREKIEEKIRLVEERRKLREDELKSRLRAKSARFRSPASASSTEETEDAAATPVEPMQHPLTPDPPDLPPHSQVVREEAEGGEQVREAAGDGRESGKQTGPADRSGGSVEGGMRGESRGEGAESGSGDGEDEEEQEEEDKLTQVEELRCDQLESDSSFQRADGKDEMF
ncbi:stathmin domain-containing protein 1 [Sparus aurata]|uniref:stathmin domain-containing protein 1 n=1 Tax=Sparus aurata TaxID=8175 RepID=UPI0011C194F1|nr:stathmin domain-containing protein 1 [Sparus aurata]